MVAPAPSLLLMAAASGAATAARELHALPADCGERVRGDGDCSVRHDCAAADDDQMMRALLLQLLCPPFKVAGRRCRIKQHFFTRSYVVDKLSDQQIAPSGRAYNLRPPGRSQDVDTFVETL